jgi:hypothetical protein
MSDASRQETKPAGGRVIGATGGAVGLCTLAAALGTCCVAPWAVSVVGVAGAVALARFAFVTPFLFVGSVALLGLAFYFAYRPLPVCADGSCDRTSQRRFRWIAWLGAFLVAGTLVAALVQYL